MHFKRMQRLEIGLNDVNFMNFLRDENSGRGNSSLKRQSEVRERIGKDGASAAIKFEISLGKLMAGKW
jgi:hypothetical protein